MLPADVYAECLPRFASLNAALVAETTARLAVLYPNRSAPAEQAALNNRRTSIAASFVTPASSRAHSSAAKKST
jgi:hypothetical protein